MAKVLRQRRTGEARETSPIVPLSEWGSVVKETVVEIKRDRAPITAAGVALYWFLSVFPLIFAGVALLSLLELNVSTVENINRAIGQTLPGSAATILTDAIQKGQDRTGGGLLALAAGLVVAVWSASSGMAAVQEGLGVAYDVREQRSFWKKRLVGILLILVAFVLAVIASALLVFAKPVGSLIQGLLPSGPWFTWAWTVVRWLVGIVAVMALFSVFYLVAPNQRRPGWKWALPGAVVATLIWVAASAAFSVYISNFARGTFAERYGALAGVVILVLWLLLSSLALMVGGELNAVLEKRHRSSLDRASRP